MMRSDVMSRNGLLAAMPDNCQQMAGVGDGGGGVGAIHLPSDGRSGRGVRREPRFSRRYALTWLLDVFHEIVYPPPSSRRVKYCALDGDVTI